MNINVKFVDTAEENQSQLDIEAIRESIVKATQIALDFLKWSGFEYTDDLTISYICGESALHAHSILRANFRMEEYQAMRDGMENIRIWLSMFHNINLSDEAVDEFSRQLTENSEEVSSSLRHDAPHEFDNETDIFIYNGADVSDLHDLLVHELWHLIESKAGVFRTPECIHEGTAVYVQKMFLGIRDPSARDFYPEGSSAHALYDLVSRIVGEELDSERASISMLFEPEFRKKISTRVTTEVLPLYFQAFSREVSEQQGLMIRNNAHYAPFISSPTRENLIAALRSMGAIKWADELDGQDISSLVEYYRKITGKSSGQNSTS